MRDNTHDFPVCGRRDVNTPGAEAAGAERDDVSAQPQLSPREDLANKIRERMRAQ